MNASHTNGTPPSRAGLLTPEQEEKLREVAQSRSETNQRGTRALMLLRLHDGKPQREVAEWFDVAVRTVRYLVRDFRERGLDALDPRPSNQHRGKLSPEQERELREQWTVEPPRHAEEARELIRERYALDYTVRGMAKMLKRFGLQYQYMPKRRERSTWRPETSRDGKRPQE